LRRRRPDFGCAPVRLFPCPRDKGALFWSAKALTKASAARGVSWPPLARIAGRRPASPEQAESPRDGVPTPTTGVCVEPVAQDKTKLFDEIIEVICKEGMVDREKVTPDATIESLDLKSIDIVMILTAIEEKFDVYIPMDGSFQDAKTVQDLIDALTTHIEKEKKA
jgi:acyl carrier protein